MRPTRSQEKRLNAWIGTYRFVYNETIWLLNLRIVHPNFMAIKKYLIPHLAEEYPWTKDCPRAIRDGAVAEACQTIKQAIATFKRTGEFSRCRYKSRKDAQQSFFLRNDQWSKDRRGFNVSALGEVKFAEALPMSLRDGRVIKFANKWYVSLPVLKESDAAENQGRLVALDPGVRTFQTFFSDHHAGHLGQDDFQRIVRLAHHLDRLLSRRDKAEGKRKRLSFTRAADAIRRKIKQLIDELHWKVARFLTDNFDVILLPTFETKQMTTKAGRKLRRKSVRSLLSFAHFRFSQRLEQKCIERGKTLVRVCEAYTSKTASWTGEIVNIGAAKVIRSNGIEMERDENGARGIFLRALVDSPILIEGAR
nr:transposase [Halochromatium salexigens]